MTCPTAFSGSSFQKSAANWPDSGRRGTLLATQVLMTNLPKPRRGGPKAPDAAKPGGGIPAHGRARLCCLRNGGRHQGEIQSIARCYNKGALEWSSGVFPQGSLTGDEAQWQLETFTKQILPDFRG